MQQKMNEFIKYFAKVYRQNPSLEITKDSIYYGLTIYDLSIDEQRNNSLDNLFANLMDSYKDKKLNVFHSPRQINFLQMQNIKGKCEPSKLIKIYLSFPKESIEECAKIIFDYIDKNNLSSYSKISNKIRSDSVVLRISDQDEAINVLNFINNNDYLCSQAKQTNPFLLRYGICGMGYDELLSYNSCISSIICDYLIEQKALGTLDEASIEGLKNYVEDFYNNIFINCKNLKQFSNSLDVLDKISKFGSLEDCILNWQKVVEMFKTHLDGNLDINKYFELYNNFNNKELSNYKKNKYSQIKLNIDKRDSINKYIELAIAKYGMDNTIKQLKAFSKNSNYSLITRDHGMRFYFEDLEITGYDVLLVTNNDIDKYVRNYKANKENMQKYNIFETICNDTFNKYGTKHFIGALLEAYYNNNFDFFNNSNSNERAKISEIFKDNKEQIISYCKIFLFKLGYDEKNIPSGIDIVYFLGNELEKNNYDLIKNNDKFRI